jgi:hypothetical protein
VQLTNLKEQKSALEFHKPHSRPNSFIVASSDAFKELTHVNDAMNSITASHPIQSIDEYAAQCDSVQVII